MSYARTVFVLLIAVLLVSAAPLQADKKAKTTEKAVAVQSKNVCMINDRSMTIDQIPVEVDGKTYYGCCPMCKERLNNEPETRYATDPVSGKRVDKAKAVIGALPGSAVLYFENAENLAKYNSGERAKPK